MMEVVASNRAQRRQRARTMMSSPTMIQTSLEMEMSPGVKRTGCIRMSARGQSHRMFEWFVVTIKSTVICLLLYLWHSIHVYIIIWD